MNKIMAVIGRDIRSGTRDWLIIYLSFAAILIALILRALIPSVSSSALNVVMLENATPELITFIEANATVSFVDDEEALKERILRIDDVVGLKEVNGKFEIIKQGNEAIPMETSLKMIMATYGKDTSNLPMTVAFSDIGWEISPIKLEGGSILIIFTTVFGGMLILLNLVEEKMSNTLSAINVTPMSRPQFIFGKGILGFSIPVIGGICAAIILGFGGINIWMFIVSILSIALISIIVGFSIGVTNNEPISAIASMKMVFVPILASVFGAMFLPDKWHFTLYWSPYYWAYDSIHAILLQEATWLQVLRDSGIIIVLTGLIFLALRKRIMQGLR